MNTNLSKSGLSGLEALLASMETGAESEPEQIEPAQEQGLDSSELIEISAGEPDVTKSEKKEKKPAKKAVQKSEPAITVKPEPVVAAVEPKKPAEPRIFFGRNRMGRLEHRLGSDLDDIMLLEFSELKLDAQAREDRVMMHKGDFTLFAVKVQARGTSIIEYASGKAQGLNPVIETTLRLLAKDRQVVMGDKGNLFAKLSSLYTPGSARAMGNSAMGALEALKLVVMSEKGKFVANDQSTLLERLAGLMSLTFIEQDVELPVAALPVKARAAIADDMDALMQGSGVPLGQRKNISVTKSKPRK